MCSVDSFWWRLDLTLHKTRWMSAFFVTTRILFHLCMQSRWLHYCCTIVGCLCSLSSDRVTATAGFLCMYRVMSSKFQFLLCFLLGAIFDQYLCSSSFVLLIPFLVHSWGNLSWHPLPSGVRFCRCRSSTGIVLCIITDTHVICIQSNI